MPVHHEFQLFKQRRFLPLFITQFLGATNDNLFKNALIMLLAFGNTTTVFNPDTLINICAALFILPYFLFSALAGQLADKYEKSNLIVLIKFVEVLLSILIILGLYFHHLPLLLTALFLLGTQATFFGPLKYSILPQHLSNSELVGGNGLIEMGTFIAILLGTILGAGLMGFGPYGIHVVTVLIGFIALFGFFASFFIPKAKSFTQQLKMDWHLPKQTFQIIQNASKNPAVFYAILGISWFWLYGSIFLTQTAHYTKITLGGTEFIATLLLIAFSVGIGFGSSLYEWLSNKKIETGYVTLGAIGLTIFALDLACVKYHATTTPINTFEFLSQFQSWRILMDALLMGASGGIYLVPLYTLIQKASSPLARSRMIAANNIMNAIFMVIASLLAIIVLNLGFSIPQLFMLTAVLNLGNALFLLKLYKHPHPRN